MRIPTTGRRIPPPTNRDVFVNCPFDAPYKPIFYATVFTVIRCGFRARCALETDDATQNRLGKIFAIIDECRFGIHDISRTETAGEPPLPRFNVPFELGLFLGAKRYGSARHKLKRCIIFDIEPYRYQRFISDISGHDIHAHHGSESRVVTVLTSWFRAQSRVTNVPGGRAVYREYERFKALLPAICAERSIHPDELTFGDFTDIVVRYITLEPGENTEVA